MARVASTCHTSYLAITSHSLYAAMGTINVAEACNIWMSSITKSLNFQPFALLLGTDIKISTVDSFLQKHFFDTRK